MDSYEVRYCVPCPTADCPGDIPTKKDGTPRYKQCWPCLRIQQGKVEQNLQTKPLAQIKDAPLCDHITCTNRVDIQVLDPTKFYKHCKPCRATLFVPASWLADTLDDQQYQDISDEYLHGEDRMDDVCSVCSQASDYWLDTTVMWSATTSVGFHACTTKG